MESAPTQGTSTLTTFPWGISFTALSAVECGAEVERFCCPAQQSDLFVDCSLEVAFRVVLLHVCIVGASDPLRNDGMVNSS